MHVGVGSEVRAQIFDSRGRFILTKAADLPADRAACRAAARGARNRSRVEQLRPGSTAPSPNTRVSDVPHHDNNTKAKQEAQ